jgi:hypothetical protein
LDNLHAMDDEYVVKHNRTERLEVSFVSHRSDFNLCDFQFSNLSESRDSGQC